MSAASNSSASSIVTPTSHPTSHPDDRAYGVIPIRCTITSPPTPLPTAAQLTSSLTYLLLKNKSGHHWDFPKGHAESNEDPTQTAIREFSEETNLNPDCITLITSVGLFHQQYEFVSKHHNNKKITKVSSYYLGLIKSTWNDRVLEIKIQESEIEEYAWLPYEKALIQCTYDSSRNMLMQAHEVAMNHILQSLEAQSQKEEQVATQGFSLGAVIDEYSPNEQKQK